MQTYMQALAGSGFLMGICCPPGFLMRTSRNHPCKTQGGELLLINVRCLQVKWNRGPAGKISVRWAAARPSMAERYAHPHVHVPIHARTVVLRLSGERSHCQPASATMSLGLCRSSKFFAAACKAGMIAEVQKSFLVINTSCVQRRSVVNGGWSRD